MPTAFCAVLWDMCTLLTTGQVISDTEQLHDYCRTVCSLWVPNFKATGQQRLRIERSRLSHWPVTPMGNKVASTTSFPFPCIYFICTISWGRSSGRVSSRQYHHGQPWPLEALVSPRAMTAQNHFARPASLCRGSLALPQPCLNEKNICLVTKDTK